MNPSTASPMYKRIVGPCMTYDLYLLMKGYKEEFTKVLSSKERTHLNNEINEMMHIHRMALYDNLMDCGVTDESTLYSVMSGGGNWLCTVMIEWWHVNHPEELTEQVVQ